MNQESNQVRALSLANLIETACEHYRDSTAFICGAETLTYRDVEEKSRALACWFQHNTPLKPGDRIAIQLPNILEFPIAAFAALRAGLILVNTNPLYTQREMLHQFRDSGVKAIVIFSPLSKKLAEIINDTDIGVVVQSHGGDIPNIPTQRTTIQKDMASIISLTKGMTLKPTEVRPEDICMLQYTGGTTGLAKGACLTNRSVIFNTLQTADRLADNADPGNELYVCPLPLYHIYAFAVNLILFFSQGNTNILIPNPRDLDAFVEQIKPHRFTGFAGINTLFVGLCNHEGFKQLDFSELKLTLSGGTALVESARLAWKEVTGCSITEGYGMSETSPVISLNHPGEEHYGTVGPPLKGTQLEIWDINNRKLPDGHVGEIVVKGDLVMKGYWNNPEETKQAITSDGYFKTGDMGRILEDGCIEIVDRLKDMVIVSGFNVYPSEVEHVLCSHGDVLEAAVIGVPDDNTGESVRAYITATPELDVDELKAYCRENLTPYKVPKEIVTVTELPKTAVGKILRKDLREIAEKIAP
ncbi:AMP-binding protein [Enterovibrio sp. ZSDZ35]|uniref:Long-chain-fatty-acid--CoA ligase n=1 Tax=Enterovibrio qingdaonensis TaxID=2899818 RepID=A0ABT5QP67_9GAMM|nr:AMP-binding protein [Enterovibrio sp. ZSDZ35]MDD1782786.1 AMP-binding protein [Enterovibrio sp. ZSDZ35]